MFSGELLSFGSYTTGKIHRRSVKKILNNEVLNKSTVEWYKLFKSRN